DFDDVDVNFFARHSTQFFLELVNFSALAADNDPWAGGQDGNAASAGGTLDEDLRHRGRFQFLFEQLADLPILAEQFAELFLAGIPFRAPVTIYRDAQADWISFLSHNQEIESVKTILMWQFLLIIGPAEPRALGVIRRKLEAVWARASLMTSWSVFRRLYSFLCALRSSALAMAESR